MWTKVFRASMYGADWICNNRLILCGLGLGRYPEAANLFREMELLGIKPHEVRFG